MIICPPGAVICPVLTTVPPIKLSFCPEPTAKLPALTIDPKFCVVKAYALGSPTNAA